MKENLYYNDLESLKFSMFYDPQINSYTFKSTPWFLPGSYLQQYITDTAWIVNKILIETHKKYLFYSSALCDELIASLRESWPHEFFDSLDASLEHGYKEFREAYTLRRSYKAASGYERPSKEIAEAWSKIFEEVYDNVSKVDADLCNSLSMYAHHVAQALLLRQEVFLHTM